MSDEIPLATYNLMMGFTLILIVFTLVHRENIVRIITGFISALLSYTNAMFIVTGKVVLYYANGNGGQTIPVTNLTYNYFWTFMAIMMSAFTVLFIVDMINEQFQTALEDKRQKEEVEYGL